MINPMKITHTLKLSSTIATLTVGSSLFGQGFANLDFESAMVAGYSPGSSIPSALAFPGWSIPPSTIYYDAISLGGAVTSINDLSTGLGYSPLEGTFSAFLFGGTFNTPVSISQTGLVPAGTTTIQLWQGTFMALGGFELSMDGQVIPMTTISSQSGYVVRVGDVSAYAGNLATLQITALGVPTGPGPNPVLIDNIQFVVPEPTTISLIGLGLLSLLWHRWSKKQ
jgi:hypothetical protein